MDNLQIRPEEPSDIDVIRKVVAGAFQEHPHSNQTEHLLVDALRAAGALTLSLVAVLRGQIVGHIALSPVTIDGRACDWFGLAPVSVLPLYQGQGVGGRLVQDALERLRLLGAKGCVLLGEPGYYGRFGFEEKKGLTLAGVPPEYFLALSFTQDPVQGAVDYHPAFSVCA
ncbi:GNAT family N-acetyltransferase [Desulfuromonas versatilis]|uniref:GNAT family N-acetyltransferase n=1 Tax=Desulfuromonas versatilis TaxID=2802975 RepID=A0ABM8HY20_9BACT|nr:N-acetyltransferase [Desulfuromonas versatilis]BCR05616.1 GNAT family N-acetyltransferase [Desulfuromonas versatilis]